MTSLSDHDRSSTILSAEAGWAPPATTASSVDRRTASVVGAAVAAAICVVIAAIGWQIAPEGWVLGIVGLPATTFLAWKMSPGVVAADRQGAVARAIGLTVATILITDALVIAVLIGAAALGMPGFGLGAFRHRRPDSRRVGARGGDPVRTDRRRRDRDPGLDRGLPGRSRLGGHRAPAHPSPGVMDVRSSAGR